MGGPYAPDVQSLGGVLTIKIDVPICAVFLVLYLVVGIVMQTKVIKSSKRGRKFGFCGMMGGTIR